MIETYNLKNKRGIGLIVCFYLFVPPLAAALALASLFSKPSLLRVAEFCITDRFSLGTSLFWGILFSVFGFIMTIPFFVTGEPFDHTLRIFWGVFFVPMPFAGVALLLHRIRYRKYKMLADAFLATLQKDGSFRKDMFYFRYNDVQYTYDKVMPLMEDFRRCGILKFVETETEVNYYFPVKEVKQEVYEEQVWKCCSCGAENRQQIVVGKAAACEYCGTLQ